MSGDHHHDHHRHGSGPDAQRGLLATLALQLGIMVVEVVGSYWSHSLSLLSDAGHMLTDVLALCLSLWAIRLASRPAQGRHTFGYHRAEILAAMLNALSLVAMSCYIFVEAYQRYQNPPEIVVSKMLAVASVGLAGNLFGIYLLASVKRTANIRSVLLHILGDTLASVGVVVGAVIIMYTGLVVVDLIVSVAVGFLILIGALNLLRDGVEILLETAPPGLDSERIIAAMQKVAGVNAVHEFHLWRITHELPALSAHIDVDPGRNRDDILAALQALLANDFSIRHTTLQLEIDRLVTITSRKSPLSTAQPH